ncbi:MAG TPA: hypothetical protein VHR15_20365 [Ktedonobacterales bacterium]|nr:hypothetical protein [Ktedonobacterales bacterium]
MTRMILLAGVLRLTRPLNVRRTLLAAVDAFLEASPTSLPTAHRFVARCRKACPSFTLGNVVWGYFITHLTDSLFDEDSDYLRDLRMVLSAGSQEIYRTYLNFDFARDLTPHERAWLATLSEMLEFLGRYPFADTDAALQEYARRVDPITLMTRLSPPPRRLEDETIYHLILREVSAILTTVDLRYSLLRSTHLTPQSPYASYPPQPRSGRNQAPDISADLDWARRALLSLQEQAWLLVTWQVTPTHYHLSLH